MVGCLTGCGLKLSQSSSPDVCAILISCAKMSIFRIDLHALLWVDNSFAWFLEVAVVVGRQLVKPLCSSALRQHIVYPRINATCSCTVCSKIITLLSMIVVCLPIFNRSLLFVSNQIQFARNKTWNCNTNSAAEADGTKFFSLSVWTGNKDCFVEQGQIVFRQLICDKINLPCVCVT